MQSKLKHKAGNEGQLQGTGCNMAIHVQGCAAQGNLQACRHQPTHCR